ncbi:hypothetical protein ACQJBY_005338 [Aegilops geniculata]
MARSPPHQPTHSQPPPQILPDHSPCFPLPLRSCKSQGSSAHGPEWGNPSPSSRCASRGQGGYSLVARVPVCLPGWSAPQPARRSRAPPVGALLHPGEPPSYPLLPPFPFSLYLISLSL